MIELRKRVVAWLLTTMKLVYEAASFTQQAVCPLWLALQSTNHDHVDHHGVCKTTIYSNWNGVSIAVYHCEKAFGAILEAGRTIVVATEKH